MRSRRVHGWIPHYRSPTDRNAIDPTWKLLLDEYGMRMGDTICGQDERHRVVARYRGDLVTCQTCRSLIASMIQRAFRVLLGMPEGVVDGGTNGEREDHYL